MKRTILLTILFLIIAAAKAQQNDETRLLENYNKQQEAAF
jgi:hypothetical protein